MNLSVLASLVPPPAVRLGLDCGSYASPAPQHHPGCGVLSRFTPPISVPFSALWAIRVAYSRFWPTITPERCNRGHFVLFCGGGTGVAAVFPLPWPTITPGAGAKARWKGPPNWSHLELIPPRQQPDNRRKQRSRCHLTAATPRPPRRRSAGRQPATRSTTEHVTSESSRSACCPVRQVPGLLW